MRLKTTRTIMRVVICALLLFSFNAYATSQCFQWRFLVGTSPGGTWQTSPEAAFAELTSYCMANNANKLSCQTTTRCYPSTIGTTCNIDNYSATLTPSTYPQYLVTGGVMATSATASGTTYHYTDSWGPSVTYRANPAGCQTFMSALFPPQTQCESCTQNGLFEPINPATGAVYDTFVDLENNGSSTGFKRFYNSADGGGGDLSSGWRHSYTRRLRPHYVGTDYRQYIASPDNSSLYSDEASACTSGFPQIKSRVSTWANATASYVNGSCVISAGGATIATLQIWYRSPPTPPPTSLVLNGYDVTRDDGQLIRFTISNGVPTAPPGIGLKLQTTPSGYTITDTNDTIETYDPLGKLLSITSRAGVIQSLSYDTSNRIAGVVDSFGQSLAFGYNISGRLTSVTDTNSKTVQYGYDTTARLSTVTAPDNSVRTYVYENTSLPSALTGVIDENNSRYSTWNYDTQGRAISTYEAGNAGNGTLVYNTDGSVTATDALNAVRTFTFGRYGDRNLVTGISGSQCPTCAEPKATTYDSQGYLASRTDYNNNVTKYTYDDARGLETSRTEAYNTAQARTITTTWHATYRLPLTISVYNGGTATGTPIKTTTFTYDGAGNQLTQTITDPINSISRVTTYTYNSYGQVLTVDGPRTDVSDITTYTYYNCSAGYQCGQIASITNAAGQVTTFNTYNAYGQPLTLTDANGVVTTLTYDARRRLTSRSVGSEITSFEYWPTGLLKKVTLPDGSYLSYSYDNAHRLTQIQDGQGNKVVYTLDLMGNHTAENVYDPSNALARTRSSVFNSLNQLNKDLTAAGTVAQTTTFGYDNNGNQTTINAPLTRNTTNQYDALNRLKQVTDPNNGITNYSYDANDNLTSVIDPRNLTTTYNYNGLANLTSQVSPDTGTTTNTYDSGGNLKTSTDANNATVTYSFDALNRVTQATYSDQTINYTYDQNTNGKGHLTAISDASGSTSVSYTPQGRIAAKTQVVGSITKSMMYIYNTVGQLTQLTTPSGQNITYTYNNGKIATVTVNSTALISSIAYDPFGPIKQWTWGNGAQTSRTYDQDGKLTSISTTNTNTYSFDDAFRITANTDSSDGTLSWTYGYDLLDRLTSASKTTQTETFTFDADGNRLTQGGTTSTTFTNASTSNKLNSTTGALTRTYTYDNDGHTLSDGTRTFTYNAAGRLITATSAGVTTTYTYNALGQRVKKSNSNGTIYFVYDESGRELGEYDQAGNLIQELVWLNDIPVATIRTDQSGGSVGVFYIHTDHLNAPTKITRPSDNAIIWRWDHDPYGNGTPNQDPDGNGLSLVFNLRFPGQYYDAETGLYYNWNRYYDQSTGRYISSDPIGLAGGLNTYAYAAGNPLTYVDVDGKNPWLLRIEFTAAYEAATYAGAATLGSMLGIGLYEAFHDDPTQMNAEILVLDKYRKERDKQKAKDNQCKYEDDGGCERNQKLLLSQRLVVSNLFNAGLMKIDQYATVAAGFNARAIAHNLQCPSNQVSLLPIGPQR